MTIKRGGVFVSICSLQTYDKASTARLPNYLIETQSFFHSFFRGKNGAWPRTPYGPSRGSEGGRREIFESYSSCTLPTVPPLVAAPPPFPLFRGHYGCWAFESIYVYGGNAGKPSQPPLRAKPGFKGFRPRSGLSKLRPKGTTTTLGPKGRQT